MSIPKSRSRVSSFSRRSLDLRGDYSTGWTLAHRMNCRARLGDGEIIVRRVDTAAEVVLHDGLEVGVDVAVELGVLLIRCQEVEILVLPLVVRLMDEDLRILFLIGGPDLGGRLGIAIDFGLAGCIRIGRDGRRGRLVLGMGAKCQAHRAERGKKQRLFHVLLDFGRFVYCKYNQIFPVVINR